MERSEIRGSLTGRMTSVPDCASLHPGCKNKKQKPREDFVIYVVATLTIKPETRAELIAAAKTCIGITRKEKGCILYDLHESTTDPARFVFVEQWETMEDLMAHGGNEHMKPWRKVVKECMTAPTKIEIITPEKVDVR
jgi:quinol monooxygenase YgiN